MILVFGSINIDLIARVKAIARPGETVLSERYDTAFGGKGANQAVAAARALRDPNLRVAMAGAIGDDAFGRAALDNLIGNRVDTAAVRTVAEPTGCAFITVDGLGENAITVASGANRAVAAADVADDLLRSASVVVLQMEIPAAETLALATRARRFGARIILNLAPAPDGMEADLLRDLLAATDVLVANEHEALAAKALLGGAVGADHEAAMTGIATGRDLIGVVTLGSRGAAAMFPNGTVSRAAALPVEVLDSTGAGDTFVGILAAGLAEALPFTQALERACRGASLACLTLGAQAGMPDAAALDGPPAPVS
jgi:ribokinase